MSKIDTTGWVKFKVGELFSCETTGGIANKNLLTEGDIPYVTRSAENNGHSSTCGNEDRKVKGNCITIGAEGFKAFYQEKDFVAGNKVYALRHPDLNKYNALYFVAALNVLSSQYSFNDARVLDRIKDEEILLPAKTINLPDLEYMEQYMRALEDTVSSSLTALQLAQVQEKKKIETEKWERFNLYDTRLFKIESGTKLDKSKMSDINPEINFVGRSSVNNGITRKVDRIEGLEPYEKGCLTLSLGGEYLGSCFVQSESFYTSQNVNVLIPTWDMPHYCKIFICAAVFKESRLKYKAFVDELNRHVKTDFSIPLPITENGDPDWDYMEQYMKSIYKHVTNTIDNFKLFLN